jgi:Fic family protein
VISSMEPLLPGTEDERLAELSRDIFHEAGKLCATLPSSITRRTVAELVREMNSYYSNLIEGHKTLPRDIERALVSDFSSDAKRRQNQHLAAAHIRVEGEMEQRLKDHPEMSIHRVDFLCWLHAAFYGSLPEEFQYALTASGKPYPIEAGKLRTFNVNVGTHVPPPHGELHAYLDRFAAFYEGRTVSAANGLVAVAAAHHRLTWIHPFGDGNGRVARLYSHAALIRQQVDGLGLWTLSRGLARFRDRYYDALGAADRPRQNDCDGRGALTGAGLEQFCVFFLETVLDQIRFMGELLALPTLLPRIENYVHRETAHGGRHKERLCRLLRAVLTEGELARSRVSGVVGLKPSAARLVTRLALDEGLVTAPTPKGPLQIAFPSKVLDAYFPRLFLDLPLDEG